MSVKLEFTDLKSQYAALKDRIAERMQRVLDHGQYIMGPEVAELEQRLAAYTGAKHCITVASGTEALLIALMALGLKPGDEVITTLTSGVAGNAGQGAAPRFTRRPRLAAVPGRSCPGRARSSRRSSAG